ncbi:hypothetical protein [Spiroplasma endosymbiont of Apeira syringaria]|uniref:hypothetical protein n=1 Tax=Spiroplasma endosymbiont of Apeira syringaria TaxID=3066307 RepID=UPI0030CFAA11
MSDFTFDEKENYSLDDVKNLLKQHRNVVYAESKKNIEPKLSEYETKLKEGFSPFMYYFNFIT